MDKPQIKFSSWPFSKDEKVSLIKISKPYYEKGKCLIDAVYLMEATRQAKRHPHHFGDLPLLICGAKYLHTQRQDMPPTWTIFDVHLSRQAIKNRRPLPYLNKDSINQKEFDYYTFGFRHKDLFFIVPAMELLRAALAPDVFWLNQIAYLDSIDTRVVHESSAGNLFLSFSPEVSLNYAKHDEKIRHAAWIFSNPNIYKMINQTNANMQRGVGIKFDFLFDELSFVAKAEVRGTVAHVKEITLVKGKSFLCKEIIVSHPGSAEYEKDDEKKEKKWTPVEKAAGGRELVSDKSATPNKLDMEEYVAVPSEYSSFAKIVRVKHQKSSGALVSTNTRPLDSDGKNKRTTADFGGTESVPQIEFTHCAGEKREGVFGDIFALFSLMKNRAEVVSITSHVGALLDHYSYRTVCMLEDGSTPRKYLAGKISLSDGREAMIVEIERENLKLATLLLVASVHCDWNRICHTVVKGFVKNYGAWPNVEHIMPGQLRSCRFNHTNADCQQKEKRIFNALFQ